MPPRSAQLCTRRKKKKRKGKEKLCRPMYWGGKGGEVGFAPRDLRFLVCCILLSRFHNSLSSHEKFTVSSSGHMRTRPGAQPQLSRYSSMNGICSYIHLLRPVFWDDASLFLRVKIISCLSHSALLAKFALSRPLGYLMTWLVTACLSTFLKLADPG